MPIDQSLHAIAQPWIAPRARLVFYGLLSAGALVWVAPAVVPNHCPARAIVLSTVRSGFGYLLLGTTSRFLIQHHRSRMQAAVLLGVVASVEAARRRRGTGAVRVATWLVGSAAVCLGVVMAKWALEPGALSDALGVAEP